MGDVIEIFPNEFERAYLESKERIRSIVHEMGMANSEMHRCMRTMEELSGINIQHKECCLEIAQLLTEILDVTEGTKTQTH